MGCATQAPGSETTARRTVSTSSGFGVRIDDHAAAAAARARLDHELLEAVQRLAQVEGAREVVRRHGAQQRLLAEVEADHVLDVGLRELVVGHAGAERVDRRRACPCACAGTSSLPTAESPRSCVRAPVDDVDGPPSRAAGCGRRAPAAPPGARAGGRAPAASQSCSQCALLPAPSVSSTTCGSAGSAAASGTAASSASRRRSSTPSTGWTPASTSSGSVGRQRRARGDARRRSRSACAGCPRAPRARRRRRARCRSPRRRSSAARAGAGRPARARSTPRRPSTRPGITPSAMIRCGPWTSADEGVERAHALLEPAARATPTRPRRSRAAPGRRRTRAARPPR